MLARGTQVRVVGRPASQPIPFRRVTADSVQAVSTECMSGEKPVGARLLTAAAGLCFSRDKRSDSQTAMGCNGVAKAAAGLGELSNPWPYSVRAHQNDGCGSGRLAGAVQWTGSICKCYKGPTYQEGQRSTKTCLISTYFDRTLPTKAKRKDKRDH